MTSRGARAVDRLLGGVALSCGGLLGAGCAGGLPLLHPAATLGAGEVRAVGGFSGQFATSGLDQALRDAAADAKARSSAPGAPGTDATFAKGALVAASVAPGLAPLVGARVGLGADYEAGLIYTGRALRADVRRSLPLSAHWAASLGVGGSAVLYGHDGNEPLPNVDLGRLHGWGADAPLVVGYQSDGGLYAAWIGARGGWERADISLVQSAPGSAELGGAPIGLSATRWWAGGLFGVAAGFRHLHVAIEVDASYASIAGSYNETETQVAGWTLTPGGSLWWRF
ncbi:MAG TPA: hypothetical protein VE987_14055 [Polyangiaceae bacterium]|nr:hypothetical protein [Polyangiaceae bacterium]